MNITPNQLVFRWPQPQASHLNLWKQVGVDVILLDQPNSEITSAAVGQGINVLPSSDFPALATDGLWPGIRRPASAGRDIEVASASREPWIDSNLYLAPFQRALALGEMPLLAYRADAKAGIQSDVQTPFHTLSLALIEARINGGNIILDLPSSFRQALDLQAPAAVEAWNEFGTIAKWLRQTLFIQPPYPTITVLVEPTLRSREIANLLFRRGASPRLVSASALPNPDPQILVFVAAGLNNVPAQVFRHAEIAGSTVVLDSPAPAQAKLRKQEADRAFYSLGKGTVVTYNKRIVDPSEFALDVIDLVTHKRRPCRIWNAPSAVGTATVAANSQQAILRVVNYGAPLPDAEIQAHVQGQFSKAELLSPGGQPQQLTTARRGTSTEVFLTKLDRLAVIVFSK